MKKLESPKVGENFSVLEMAKQFNENDEIDSLPSSKMSNAFRHFDFEDDGEGDFENFEMSLKPSSASSGHGMSHTLPKSSFEVPVSKKFDQFGRRKSDEIKKDQIKKSGSGNLTKIGGTSSADGLDKVGQKASITSSMKRTTSFEALKVFVSFKLFKRMLFIYKNALISPLCLQISYSISCLKKQARFSGQDLDRFQDRLLDRFNRERIRDRKAEIGFRRESRIWLKNRKQAL